MTLHLFRSCLALPSNTYRKALWALYGLKINYLFAKKYLAFCFHLSLFVIQKTPRGLNDKCHSAKPSDCADSNCLLESYYQLQPLDFIF